MKSTSPIPVLLLLQLLTGVRAVPIPFHHDCQHYASCDPSIYDLLTELALDSKAHAPPRLKLLSDPHFPAHQLNSPLRPSPEDGFERVLLRPPPTLSPSSALSANAPLQTTYLLSLFSPSAAKDSVVTATDPALPSKPTSALPDLRREDERRYWNAVLRGEEPVAESCGQHSSMHIHRGMMSGRHGWKITRSREYSDLLVVGIVILFLCVVIVVEVVEKIGDFREYMYGSSRGAIRLEEGETFYIVQKPFQLQPAPPPKYKTRAMRAAAAEGPYSDKETGMDKVNYDTDAIEKQ